MENNIKIEYNFFVIYPRNSYEEANYAMQLIGYSIGMDYNLLYADISDETEYYHNVIVPAIEKADFVLAFINKESESEYLVRESVNLCNNLNKNTIPVKLGNEKLNEKIWKFRSSIFDFSDKNRRVSLIEQICAWIGTIVNNGHVCIDLGLPSEVRWASCNIGAITPEEKGNLYYWGETAVPQKKSQGYSKNPESLPPNNDAATVNWGTGWRMPTHQEMYELKNNCTWKWVGSGYKVIGPNGHCIFLPTTGYRNGDKLCNTDTEGHYWSRTLRSGLPSYVWYIMFKYGYQGLCYRQRNMARAVRAVHSIKAIKDATTDGESTQNPPSNNRTIIIIIVCLFSIIILAAVVLIACLA